MKPNIELAIEELVLKGFSRYEAFRIKEALIFKLKESMAQTDFNLSHNENISIAEIVLPPISSSLEMNPKILGFSIADNLCQNVQKTLNTTNGFLPSK